MALWLHLYATGKADKALLLPELSVRWGKGGPGGAIQGAGGPAASLPPGVLAHLLWEAFPG